MKGDNYVKRLNLDKQSIVFKMTYYVILLIVIQSLFLGIMLILGGVISQGEKNAFQFFNEKVKNKNDSLHKKMNGKWTNMLPYMDHISQNLTDANSDEEFFENTVEDLIKLLRSTETTGAFIILDSDSEEHSSLYIRDYDPLLNAYYNKDLHMLLGSADIAKQQDIPLDYSWKYKIKFDDSNKDLFEKPYSKAKLTSNSNLLGYWSRPFNLHPQDIRIMTYSMPLFDSEDNLRGVIGIEVSENYLSQILSTQTLQSKNSMEYLLGYSKKGIEEIKPVLTTSAYQKLILKSVNQLDLTEIDLDKNIYKVNNLNSKQSIYSSIEPLGIYDANTPFEYESWYLIGIMTENNLLGYVNKIQNILVISLITSVILGAMGGSLISYQFTRPITTLVKQVKESDKHKVINLNSTGLTEIDELSTAMETASNALLESALKMSNIIDLAGLPIAAFELNNKCDCVFFTSQFQKILNIDNDTMKKITNDRRLFSEEISNIFKTKLKDEDDTYRLDKNVDKYIRLKIIENSDITTGVVIDVSKEINEKNHIKMERDYDPLTMIFNRKAVQMHIENIIENVRPLDVAALVMFDLDNLKTTNDNYGHKWGDIYIKKAACLLSEITKSSSVLGRRSGDEFVLFLFGFKDKESIKKTMDDFYNGLKEDFIEFPDGSLKSVSISGGLLWIDDWSVSYDELLHRADELLYQAKSKGKGHYKEG